MTKFEEQELYYDNMLDKLCSMDESAQQAYLARMTEADAAKVMKAMVKRVSKNLAKAEKALTKIEKSVPKASVEVQAAVSKKTESGRSFLDDVGRCKKEVDSFKEKYLNPTTGLWSKMVSGVENNKEDVAAGANDITKADLKSLETQGKVEAINGASSSLEVR